MYMYMYVYVCIYIYIYMYMCVCVCVCVCIYIYIHVHIYTYIYICVHVSDGRRERRHSVLSSIRNQHAMNQCVSLTLRAETVGHRNVLEPPLSSRPVWNCGFEKDVDADIEKIWQRDKWLYSPPPPSPPHVSNKAATRLVASFLMLLPNNKLGTTNNFLTSQCRGRRGRKRSTRSRTQWTVERTRASSSPASILQVLPCVSFHAPSRLSLECTCFAVGLVYF